MKLIIWFLFFGLIVSSCEEAIDRDIKPVQASLIVVDGMITNERKNHEVRLSEVFYELNAPPSPLIGASMAIIEVSRTDTTVFAMNERINEAGVYETNTPVRGLFGNFYFLYIRSRGQDYLGLDIMGSVEPLEPIQLGQADNGFLFIQFQETESPSMTKYYISWEDTGFCVDNQQCKAKTVFYSLDNADINEVFAPEKETVFFPPGSTIIRERYSLSFAHQEYIRSMLIESDWRGSIFDVEKHNVSGNMSEGALGFFAASSVVADTILVR